MNIQKFTQKSLETIQNAQTIATENQNAQVEEEHLLYSLIEQENSLIKELLKKISTIEGFEKELKTYIDKMPKMTGGAIQSDSIYVSQDVNKILADAEITAKKMKDEYVSVEQSVVRPSEETHKAVGVAVFHECNVGAVEEFEGCVAWIQHPGS